MYFKEFIICLVPWVCRYGFDVEKSYLQRLKIKTILYAKIAPPIELNNIQTNF